MLLLGGDGPVGRSAASGLLDFQIGNAVPDVFADEALRRFEQRQIRLLIDAHLEFHVVFLPDDKVREGIPELVERRLEIVSEGGRLVILKRAVSEDAFGEVVEERHGEFVVDGSLVSRGVVQDLADPIRLLVVVQKLVHEGNVYLKERRQTMLSQTKIITLPTTLRCLLKVKLTKYSICLKNTRQHATSSCRIGGVIRTS